MSRRHGRNHPHVRVLNLSQARNLSRMIGSELDDRDDVALPQPQQS